jgi:hypothetical protein
MFFDNAKYFIGMWIALVEVFVDEGDAKKGNLKY